MPDTHPSFLPILPPKVSNLLQFFHDKVSEKVGASYWYSLLNIGKDYGPAMFFFFIYQKYCVYPV